MIVKDVDLKKIQDQPQKRNINDLTASYFNKKGSPHQYCGAHILKYIPLAIILFLQSNYSFLFAKTAILEKYSNENIKKLKLGDNFINFNENGNLLSVENTDQKFEFLNSSFKITRTNFYSETFQTEAGITERKLLNENKTLVEDLITQKIRTEGKSRKKVITNYFYFTIAWVSDLFTNIKMYFSKYGNKHFDGSNNYLIDKNCISSLPAEKIDNLILDTIKQGSYCLTKLYSKKTDEHLALLTGILNSKENQLKFECNEFSFYTDRALAAGRPPWENDFPKIELNNYLLNSQSNLHDFKKTIFHELFHVIGYQHFFDVEYAYTCELCCFDNIGYSDKVKKAACNICKGEFKDTNSEEYLDKITNFYLDIDRDILANRTVRYFLMKNFNSKKARILLFYTYKKNNKNYYFSKTLKEKLNIKPQNNGELYALHLKAEFEIKDTIISENDKKVQAELASFYADYLNRKLNLIEIYKKVNSLQGESEETKDLIDDVLFDIAVSIHNKY